MELELLHFCCDMTKTIHNGLNSLLTTVQQEIILLHGPAGVPHYVSGDAAGILEVEPGSLRTVSVAEVFEERARKRILSTFSEVFKTGTSSAAFIAELANGKRSFSITTHPVKDNLGNVIELHTTLRDITPAKKFHDDVLLLNHLISETNSMARVGGWKLNFRDNDLYWSPQIYAIHEVPEGFIPTFENAIAFYHPYAQKEMTDAIAQTMADGKERELEVQLTTFTGRDIWVRSIIKAAVVNGTMEYIYGAFQDITDRKQHEVELQRVIDNLTKQNEQLEQFSNIVSHNLRGPVSGVQALLSMLDEPTSDTDVQLANKYLRDAVQELDKSIRILSRTVSERGSISE